MKTTWRFVLVSIIFFIFTLAATSCTTVQGNDVNAKRNAILEMRNKALARLYKEKPSTKNYIKEAYGYAVFSNANVNLILASFSGGYGVAHDNQQNKNTFMKMSGAGIGFGAGAKDYRVVLIFKTKVAYTDFINRGWVFGAQADATAKAGQKGASANAAANTSVVRTYVMTEAGLALQATVQGIKYWQYDELN